MDLLSSGRMPGFSTLWIAPNGLRLSSARNCRVRCNEVLETRSRAVRDGEPSRLALTRDRERFTDYLRSLQILLGQRSVGFQNQRNRLLKVCARLV